MGARCIDQAAIRAKPRRPAGGRGDPCLSPLVTQKVPVGHSTKGPVPFRGEGISFIAPREAPILEDTRPQRHKRGCP